MKMRAALAKKQNAPIIAINPQKREPERISDVALLSGDR